MSKASSLGMISADSHVVEPADLWETRLDRKHRESAPKVVQKEGKWVIAAPGGIQFPVAGQFAAGMRGEELLEHLGNGYEAGRPSGPHGPAAGPHGYAAPAA